MAVHTRSSIRRIFSDATPVFVNGVEMTRGDLAAMRAVCRLYACQLADEKVAEETKHTNDIGFAKGHAKIGTALASFMDGGKADGQFRRATRGNVNKWVFEGFKNGKKQYSRFSSEFVGRDRVEVCRYLATFYAQQLADFANGDKRNTARKVA
jgi:hypothetical protein